MIDFLIGLPVLAVLMIVYGVVPWHWQLIFLPLFIASALAGGARPRPLALCPKCSLQGRPLRDPVHRAIRPLSLACRDSVVPSCRRAGALVLFSLNPMAGVIDGMRWSLFGTRPPFSDPSFAVSLAMVAALLVSGVWYFRRTERTFADASDFSCGPGRGPSGPWRESEAIIRVEGLGKKYARPSPTTSRKRCRATLSIVARRADERHTPWRPAEGCVARSPGIESAAGGVLAAEGRVVRGGKPRRRGGDHRSQRSWQIDAAEDS